MEASILKAPLKDYILVVKLSLTHKSMGYLTFDALIYFWQSLPLSFLTKDSYNSEYIPISSMKLLSPDLATAQWDIKGLKYIFSLTPDVTPSHSYE